MQTFSISEETTILDVGGTPYNWQLINCPAQITLVNIKIPDPLPELPPNINYIQGDGTDLHFADQTFNIVFSNSVIEHLHSAQNQQKFASEVSRVGKQLWVQTPSKNFFFDPHFITPFFHWLPKKDQMKLARNFTIWGLLTRPAKENIAALVDQICLLTFDEFAALFPDCLIRKEMFLGFAVKSFIAIRKESVNYK